MLSGARERGQTALEWSQRLKIVINIAQAIAFIHSQHPHKDKDLYLNVHGNVKTSNVMLNVDFTACLADYGFAQLAARTDYCNTPQHIKSSPSLSLSLSPPLRLIRSNFRFSETLSQKSDVYNFGVILLDVLGIKKSDVVNKKQHGKTTTSCFEFDVEGKEKRQALGVWDIALACMKKSPEERPDMEQVLALLYDVKKVKM